ncbi:MAG: hypothetical protein IT494_08900 [Gammaproteobacteria bacterium]|nr:hypothetical protein [Gammaproteobacteria bacterium]
MLKAKSVVALGVAILVTTISQGAGAACDRACLLRLADDYLAALAAKAPARVPFATNVRMVENAKRIKPGEGLWQTTTGGPTEFKLIVPDAVSQQVGGIVMMQSEGKPAQIGFRLKLENDRITEAEHLIALPREQSLANLERLRPGLLMEVPYEYADSRGRLIHIAKSYYDALDWNNGNLSPFAPDCDRRENGMRTAPSGGPSLGGTSVPGTAARPATLLGMQDCTSQINSQTFQYIDRIDNRRVEIADEKTGLVIGLSHFRHEMKQKEFPILNDPGRTSMTMNFDPFDLPALHVYKIWGGQIHEIEALGFMAPYNAPTGWE